MLQVVILLHILCFVPGDAFPQRTNPHDQSNFDFDAYLKNFAPTRQTVLNHPRSFLNQEYRYIPLLGERPDYIPPIVQRGHFPHPQIPKRIVKHRSWHSTYQNSNFPTSLVQQPPKDLIGHGPFPIHRGMQRPTSQFSVPTSDSNFRIHSKMEDLGDYEAPVVEETKKEHTIHQQNEDYDFPVVLESIVEKHTDGSLKRKNHKTEISVVPTKDVVSIKENIKQNPNYIKPSLDEEYDTPVVVESLVKVGNSKINVDHPNVGTSNSDFSDYEEPIVLQALTKVRNPVHKKNSHTKHTKVGPVKKIVKINQMKPNDKPVTKTPVYLEDYKSPEVVHEFTREELTRSKGKVGHKVKEQAVNEDLKLSIIKPTNPVYSEDYDVPVVVAAFTDELGHSKGHVADQKKKHSDKQSKPVVKKTPGYSEDYEAPVMLEAFTKDDLTHHTGKKKIAVKEKPVAKLDEVKLDYSSEKTGEPCYSEDCKASPILVEALTKKESVHKENAMKTVTKHQSPKKSKDDHNQDESTEDYKTEEYDYKELENYLLNEDTDYEGIDTRNELHNDLDDYSNEDLTEESLVPVVHQSGTKHSQKSAIKTTPVKIDQEVNDNDKNYSKVPSVKGEGYIALETSQSKKRVKRQTIDDVEFPEINEFGKDYEVPVIVETIKREKDVPNHHNSKPNSEVVNKPNYVEPSPDEDYEYPVIVEEFSKGALSSGMENKFESRPAHFKPNTETLIGNKHPNFILPSPDEEYESPVRVETIAKVTGVSSEKDRKIPSKVHAHSRPNQEVVTTPKPNFVEQYQDEDYEMPEIVETIAKVTKPMEERIPSGVKPQNKDYETAVEALAKSIKNPADLVTKENANAYSVNKRKREYAMEYRYPAHSDRQDAHERPVDEVYDLLHNQRPGYFVEEREPHREETSFPRNFESLDPSDNRMVLDSLAINRESSDGQEVPILDVLAVNRKVDGDPDNKVEIIALNKENGEVEVINVGHEDSNHDIESLADRGSGDGEEERSLDSRSFLPRGSNSWSFMNLIQSQERRKFKRCLTPRNETGNCMPVQMCSVPNLGSSVEELLKNVCIIDEVFIGICCPEFPVETVRVDWGQLGRPDTEPLQEKVESSEIMECGKLPSNFGDKESWPWMAPLVSTTSDKVFCGGALIGESYVLTAAHCTSKIPRNQILVRLRNDQSSIEFAVIEIKRHAQYNPRTMQNDIALLKLSRKVPLGQFRRLVCLPSNDVEDFVGDTAVLLRWQGIAEKGSVESLSVIANGECQNRLGALVGGSVLCTETRNDEAMCNADSGAPLVIEKNGQFQIVGTLTWNRNDCDGNFPTVFTRVSSYLKWIQTHTK